MESQQMGPEIGLPYLLNKFQILTKASQQESPKCPTRGSSSLCLCLQNRKLKQIVPRVASRGRSASASYSGDQCHLALGEGTMVAGLLGQQGEVMGFLNLVVKGEVAIRGPGRDGLSINR